MKNIVFSKPCPCRLRDSTPLAYAQCCQIWHGALAQGEHAPSPEQLMRSRYSAYALATQNNPQGHAMLDYLLATWHTSTVPSDLELSPTAWLGLQVIHAQASTDAGVVEFVAYYKEGGKAQQMHEISRFVRGEQGQWLYIDGQSPQASA